MCIFSYSSTCLCFILVAYFLIVALKTVQMFQHWPKVEMFQLNTYTCAVCMVFFFYDALRFPDFFRISVKKKKKRILLIDNVQINKYIYLLICCFWLMQTRPLCNAECSSLSLLTANVCAEKKVNGFTFPKTIIGQAAYSKELCPTGSINGKVSQWSRNKNKFTW